MEDRRVFARINVKIPIEFLNPKNNKKGEAITMNISANGIGFITDEKLFDRAVLEMWLDIPDHQAPLYTRGEVVWSKDLPNSQQKCVGIHLEKEDLIGLARLLRIKDNDKPT